MNVEIQDGNVVGYRVSMAITFVLEEGPTAEERPIVEERPITEERPTL
jgi:hypothetical protein